MPKNYRLLRSAALLALLLVSPLNAVELYEEKKVSQIQIEVDSPDPSVSFDPKPILSRLKTKEGDQFSQFTFDSDLKSLSEEYDRVQPSIEVKGEEVTIKIRVVPRPVIHQISFSGNKKYSSRTLQSELDIEPYTVFKRQEFNKAFNKVKEFYIKKGYFESQLSYKIKQIPGTNEVDIAIEVKEGKSGNIKKIVFKGFTKQEQSDLSDTMFLKKYNFLTSWLTGEGKLRDDALEQDRTAVVNYLHNRGYVDSRVDIQIHDDPDSDKIIIEIHAERGTKYHTGQIKIEGNTLLTEEEILKRCQLKAGDVFSPEKARDTSQAIKDLYGQKGYIDASVQYELCLKEEEPIYDIDYQIEEGQQYKIGMVHVFGNHSTKNNVILRESLLVPGETFDSRKLKATQQRLDAIGYFKNVNVYAVRTSDDLGLGDNYRDVYIEVEETTTGNVSLFMGFSSTDSVFGGLDLTERNFNIAGAVKALTGSFSNLRGGGQYFHARGTLGKKEDNILVSWVNPYVNDTLWRFGVEISRTYSVLQDDDTPTRTYGGSIFTNYPLSTYWTAGIRDRLRHTYNKLKLSNPDQSPQAERNLAIQKQRNETSGLLSGISANLAYESTNSAYKPHQGWRSYLEAEIVGVGGDYRFWKFSYTNSIYIPVSTKGTVKLRGDLKFISPFGSKTNFRNVPYSERFFLGGEYTVRGYRPFSISPKIGIANAEGKTEYTDIPLGGLSSCLLAIEYNYEVFRMLDLFVFFDSGAVSFDTWNIPTLRCSTGGGIRLEINRGTPIMVGYGYPINPVSNKDRQGYFFSMSGQF
jgi:outer membrane protein insertion porin family